MFNQYFYNATLEKCAAVFGTIFNNIRIRKKNQPDLYVPIAYGPVSKALERIEHDSDLEDKRINVQLPRMGFNITGLQHDSERQLNKLNRKYFKDINVPESSKKLWQSVPYDLNIDLEIAGKTKNEILQIVEQILPTFVPEYTVAIKDFDGPGQNVDIPIILDSVSPELEVEGGFDEIEVIKYTLSFTMKIRFYGSVQDKPVILRTEVNQFDFSQLSENNPESIKTIEEFADIPNPPDGLDEEIEKRRLNAKHVVKKITDLLLPETWEDPNDSSKKVLYEGMVIYVQDEQGFYYLTDVNNFQDIDSWVRLYDSSNARSPNLITVNNVTERLALTTVDVQRGDTVKQADTGVLYLVKDVKNLWNENGYEPYFSIETLSIDWSNIKNKPTTFPSDVTKIFITLAAGAVNINQLTTTLSGEVYQYDYLGSVTYYRYISNDGTIDGFYDSYVAPNTLGTLIVSKFITF